MRRDLLYNTCVLSVCIHSELESCHLHEMSLWAVGPAGIMDNEIIIIRFNSNTGRLQRLIWPLVKSVQPREFCSDSLTALKFPSSPLPSRCMSKRALPSQLYKCLSRDTNTTWFISLCVSIRAVKPRMSPCHPPAWLSDFVNSGDWHWDWGRTS